MITPKYESSVVFFPSTTSSISKSLLSNRGPGENDILQFGEDEETERLLQVLNSQELMNRVIQKFDLFNHYNIDSSSKYPFTQLNNTFKSNFSFKRNKFLAIEITVMDEDPQLAADMANYAAKTLDNLMNEIYQERAKKAFEIVKEEYIELKKEVAKLEDTLYANRKGKSYNLQKQAEAYSLAYAEALMHNNIQGANILEKKLTEITQQTGTTIDPFLIFEKEKLSDLKSKYSEVKVEAFKSLPYIFIVDNAEKSEKRAYPTRWLIVLISTISLFLLTLVILLILDNIILIKKNNK
jgi:uncharacterized protein involved in exopolysaccharide biosynthesis